MARLTTHRALAALSGAAIIGVLADDRTHHRTTQGARSWPAQFSSRSPRHRQRQHRRRRHRQRQRRQTAPTTQTAPTAQTAAPATRWQTAITYPDKQAAAAKIVKAAGRSPVRVVTLRTVNGRPKIVAQVLSGASAANVTRQAAADPEVLALDVDTRSSALATDPYRSTQWALDTLAADTVNARHDASGVTVAVIDSGVQADHPDLAGVVLTGTDFVAPGGDGSADGAGHGTHVAGIIAAVADNGIGVAGFAHGAKSFRSGSSTTAAADGTPTSRPGSSGPPTTRPRSSTCLSAAPARDAVMESAVNYAVSRGVLVVAAAGNSRQNGNPVSYPAAFANALAVAATDVTGATASFSNTGGYVRIAAPGVNISSTWKNDGYVYASGTSMPRPRTSPRRPLS